ncbi:MAG: YHS domain-containing protein [Myxococcota bacterium]|nr:YHS domain-containing protein [Myxococcota bacterium]
MNRSILALLSVLALAACGGGSSASSTTATEGDGHHASASTSGSEQALVPMGETQIGDRSTCPVSGEEFVVSESSPTAEHDGRTYHFCCPGCAERFQADPHAYLEHHEG